MNTGVSKFVNVSKCKKLDWILFVEYIFHRIINRIVKLKDNLTGNLIFRENCDGFMFHEKSKIWK